MSEATKKVLTAISAVQEAIAKVGISKDRENAIQHYKFRGIDDVYNALSPILAENKLCIIPNIIGKEVAERKTAKGGVMFHVTVQVEYTFISSEDGSDLKTIMFGEAMDSGDKAFLKAVSSAYKCLALQTFAIPTDSGDADTETQDHKIQADDGGLGKMVETARKRLVKYDAEPIGVAFEEHGYICENDGAKKEYLIDDLLGQVDSKEKLLIIGKRVAELQKEFDSTPDTDGGLL